MLIFLVWIMEVLDPKQGRSVLTECVSFRWIKLTVGPDKMLANMICRVVECGTLAMPFNQISVVLFNHSLPLLFGGSVRLHWIHIGMLCISFVALLYLSQSCTPLTHYPFIS